MRLKKNQKEFLLALVAEGLQSDEINARAAKFKPPFSVSRQQVDFYRASRGVALEEIKAESESAALRTGLALKEERITVLNRLAETLKAELLGEEGGGLWRQIEKAVGKGESARLLTEEEFRRHEVNALRALLDDLAKEMGERTYVRAADFEDDDAAALAAQGAPQTLKIKVEYVGGDNPDAADPSSVATANQP